MIFVTKKTKNEESIEEKKHPTKEQLEDSREHYSDNGLMNKIKDVFKDAGIKVIYLVLILFYVLKSEKTTKTDMGIIIGALGYFILPFDLIPDFIPFIGYSDDFTALLACFKAIASNVTPDIERRAEEPLHEWFGDYDKKEISEIDNR